VTSWARRAAWWAVVVLLSFGGVGLTGSGLSVRETAWVHLTSFSSDAADERYRESRRSATARAQYDEEERERAEAAAAQRRAGESRMLVGGALIAVAVALGAWLRIARLRARRTAPAR
jgi:hypothetical protein